MFTSIGEPLSEEEIDEMVSEAINVANSWLHFISCPILGPIQFGVFAHSPQVRNADLSKLEGTKGHFNYADFVARMDAEK